MKSIRFSRHLPAVLAGLVLSATSTLFGGAELTGTWKWSTEGRNGETRESTLVLKQEAGKISGVLKGRRAETQIEEAKLVENQLSFKIKRETQRGTMTATYQGKVEGDTIKGNANFAFGERSMEREWVAQRQGPDPAGTWLWESEGRDGQTWEAQLVLKREGEKYVGSIQREGSDWQFQIKDGVLKGAELIFDAVVERNGETFTLKNKATLTNAGREMKGEVTGTRDGQAWSREWEAKRQ